MNIRFIEYGKREDNLLIETENSEGLSAVFVPYTQIQITKEKEKLYCKYIYNVLKVVENEIDIFVEIEDSEDIEENI